jgi:hypothetical protein
MLLHFYRTHNKKKGEHFLVITVGTQWQEEIYGKPPNALDGDSSTLLCKF